MNYRENSSHFPQVTMLHKLLYRHLSQSKVVAYQKHCKGCTYLTIILTVSDRMAYG